MCLLGIFRFEVSLFGDFADSRQFGSFAGFVVPFQASLWDKFKVFMVILRKILILSYQGKFSNEIVLSLGHNCRVLGSIYITGSWSGEGIHRLLLLSISGFLCLVFQMAQSSVLSLGKAAPKKVAIVHGMKIQVPKFDNLELIKGYSRTLIGRCLNPAKQDVQSLLHMLLRIWKIEDRVAGADLGMGRFQFDFDNESDIVDVLKMEPFHFDYWMMSLVRWEPVVETNYPSAIKFWVRMMGVPLHYWAEPTFKSIGSALGEYKGVDLDGGRIQVIMDGHKPLIFESPVEFDGGEETIIYLRYEKLHGYCRLCHSLCHDVSICPHREVENASNGFTEPGERDVGKGMHNTSYRGALVYGRAGKGTASSSDQWRDKGKQEGVGRSRRGGESQGFNGAERRHGNGTRRTDGGPRWEPKLDKRPLGIESMVREKESSRDRRAPMQGDIEEGQILSSAKKVRRSIDFTGPEFDVESDCLLEGESSQGTALVMMGTAEGSKPLVAAEELTGLAEVKEGSGVMEGDTGNKDARTSQLESDGDVMMKPAMTEDMFVDGANVCFAGDGEMAEIGGHVAAQIAGETGIAELGKGNVGARKKFSRPVMLFGGGTVKSRMVQGMLSPRKKNGSKQLGKAGEAHVPDKNESETSS